MNFFAQLVEFAKIFVFILDLGKPQKKALLMARPSTPQPQYLFSEPFFRRSKLSTAIKLEGEGGLGLNGQAIYRRTFFAASLS